MRISLRTSAIVLLCVSALAPTGTAQNSEAKVDLAIARAKYAKEHGGACDGRKAPPARSKVTGVLYVPTKKESHPSQDIPREAAAAIDASLQASNDALLACNQKTPHPGNGSATLDMKARRWSSEIPGLAECVAHALGDGLWRTPANVVPRVVIAFDAVGPDKAVGSLAKEVVQSVIHSRIADVRECYEAALDGWPDLKGRLQVRFIIEPDGSVSDSSVRTSTLGHSNVECCVMNAVDKWTFPKPAGGGIVVITYPFVLEQAAP